MQKIDDKELNRINNWLAREFGYFEARLPHWRVVWSDDEIEKRLITHSPEGLEYVRPIVMEVPKYRNWNQHRYVLERLLPIPQFVETDLVEKYSYEPVWTFETSKGEYLPPATGPIKIVIETVYEQAARAVGRKKYKDPDEGLTTEDLKEKRKQELKVLEEQLFGNETATTDALATQQGVVVPHNYGEVK